MAFLDNSGDIILDAVLTDQGRSSMARGTFRVSKFALGDDEIDYSLYNVNTGSAYTDLEILQTPVFEAHTIGNSANINYGLISHTRLDLLYLPELQVNRLNTSFVNPTGSVYYLAVNTETRNKLIAAPTTGGPVTFGDSKYVLTSQQTSETMLVVESGLNTTDVSGDKANRASYILANNLLDNSFNVYYDARFIMTAMSPPPTAVFKNTTAGTPIINLHPLLSVTPTSTGATMENYSNASVRGAPNMMVENPTIPATNYSALAGPRGSIMATNFNVSTELATNATGTRSSKYSLYGTAGSALFGGSDLYDYIDTTVYIVGATSNATLQIPLRIIRYAGT